MDNTIGFGEPVDPDEKKVNESSPVYHLLINATAGRRFSSFVRCERSGDEEVNDNFNMLIKTTN